MSSIITVMAELHFFYPVFFLNANDLQIGLRERHTSYSPECGTCQMNGNPLRVKSCLHQKVQHALDESRAQRVSWNETGDVAAGFLVAIQKAAVRALFPHWQTKLAVRSDGDLNQDLSLSIIADWHASILFHLEFTQNSTWESVCARKSHLMFSWNAVIIMQGMSQVISTSQWLSKWLSKEVLWWFSKNAESLQATLLS